MSSPNLIDPEQHPSTAKGFAYVEDVLAGKVLVNRLVRLACERHRDDIERIGSDTKFPYYFNPKKSERALRFIQLMPHTKGAWSLRREKLVLSPWQCFFVLSIFGWLHVDTGFRRFFRASLYVPRKNGKSILAAAIGLYMLIADGEHGPEVYCGATTQKQAWEIFQPAKRMIEKTPDLRLAKSVYAMASKITCGQNDGRFEPIIGNPGDGASPHCAINDEYHEQPTDVLVDTMITGMGARDQPLMLDTTTAGNNRESPCYLHQLEIESVLSGVIEDDRLFALVYGIDPDDDWKSEESLVKANPNIGVSVNRNFLFQRREKALTVAQHQTTFKTKHLNIWVGARSAYYNMELWKGAEDLTLKPEQFEHDDCFQALDLANKEDIAARVPLYRRMVDGQNHYYLVGAEFYCPETAFEKEGKKSYLSWRESGHLTETDGNIINLQLIEDDARALCESVNVREVQYDPWNATHLALRLMKDDILCVEIPMKTIHLSEPMKWIGALMLDGRFHHDGNPVMAWMMSNVTAKVDANENVFPRKEKPGNKIDGPVALIMAMNRALAEDVESDTVSEGFFEI